MADKENLPSPKYAKLFEGGTFYSRKDGYLVFQKFDFDENDVYRRLSFTRKSVEQVAQKYKEFLKKAKAIRAKQQEQAIMGVAANPPGLELPEGIDRDISLSDWVLYFINTYKTYPAVKRTIYSSYMRTLSRSLEIRR